MNGDTVVFYKSKRFWLFGLMVVARVVPVVWHDPAVKEFCDWLLNLAGGSAFYFSAASDRRMTRKSQPPPLPPLP